MVYNFLYEVTGIFTWQYIRANIQYNVKYTLSATSKLIYQNSKQKDVGITVKLVEGNMFFVLEVNRLLMSELRGENVYVCACDIFIF